MNRLIERCAMLDIHSSVFDSDLGGDA